MPHSSIKTPLAILSALTLSFSLSSVACGAGDDGNGSDDTGNRSATTMGAPIGDTDGDGNLDDGVTNADGTKVGSSGAGGKADALSNNPAAPGTNNPAAPVDSTNLGPLPFRGINLAGAEFGNVLPGVENKDYKWPSTSEVDYYLGKGMNTFRIGFKWERLQTEAFGELDAAYVAKLDTLVNYTTAKGARVILNPHNFARYYGNPVGSTLVPAAVFANLWSRLASRYASNERVIFNLVNEPNTMGTEQWVLSANAAILAIRTAGATQNTIHVPGNGWTGAYSWEHTYYGTPNAIAMLNIVDPSNKVVFEVHQYLDANSSGGSDQCVSPTIGSERLAPFIKWLRKHGKKGFVGEFAGGDNPTCNAAVQDMLQAMSSAGDVLDGWLWWAAGPWWGNYPFSLHPQNGQDKPQMSLLAPALVGATKL